MQGRLGRVFSRLVTRRLLPPCCMCLLAGRAGARVSLPCLARSPGRFWGDLGGCARGCARILLSAPHSMCGHTLLDGGIYRSVPWVLGTGHILFGFLVGDFSWRGVGPCGADLS